MCNVNNIIKSYNLKGKSCAYYHLNILLLIFFDNLCFLMTNNNLFMTSFLDCYITKHKAAIRKKRGKKYETKYEIYKYAVNIF